MSAFGLGATRMRWAAVSWPARGPLSNSTFSVTVPPVMSFGTRTEAEQKVPQANPELSVETTVPSAFSRVMRAAGAPLWLMSSPPWV